MALGSLWQRRAKDSATPPPPSPAFAKAKAPVERGGGSVLPLLPPWPALVHEGATSKAMQPQALAGRDGGRGSAGGPVCKGGGLLLLLLAAHLGRRRRRICCSEREAAAAPLPLATPALPANERTPGRAAAAAAGACRGAERALPALLVGLGAKASPQTQTRPPSKGEWARHRNTAAGGESRIHLAAAAKELAAA